MRPLVLQVSGFSSYRSPTTVDFSGSDYFVLVGATGAGKSSVIDAIGFALYGCVPRYDNRNLIAPVISQGLLEARVGLDFAIGTDTYRATRVVRAGPKGKGASTREARLERIIDGEVVETLAGDADGLTFEVERLLGLGFDHFTKCVVLPQGAFADFLHDSAARRQDLLVELLGVGLYDRIAVAANQRSAEQASRARSLAEVLASPALAAASPEALSASRDQLVAIETLRATVAAAQPEMAALQESATAAARAADAARAVHTVVTGVRAPGDVGALAAALTAAEESARGAGERVTSLEAATTAVEAALAALPERAALELAIAAHDEVADLELRIANGRAIVAQRSEAAEHAAKAAAETAGAVEDAQRALDAAVSRDGASALAAHLTLGEPCPVCEQPVSALPARHAGGGKEISRAEAALAASRKAAATADREARAASEQQAVAAGQMQSLEDRRSAAVERAAAWPDRAAAEARLAARVEAERATDAARSDERATRAAARQTQDTVAAARASQATARRKYDEARVALGALDPPAPRGDDLAADWAELETWAARKAVAAEAEVAGGEQAQRAALHDLVRRGDELTAASAAVGVVVGEGVSPAGIAEAVAAAHARAAAAVEGAEAALAEASRVEAERSSAEDAGKVAHALAQHLNARNFKQWLLDEALDVLVEGATEVLRELSDGAYSLVLEGGGFSVVDHRNADAVRSARTLSGGETFLASLSLALALADRLADLAAEGAARLEAIFLDEGFGTLDAEALDTVAAAIEALAAKGRVVGLVTHVRDLADRVPVRFEVTRGPEGSAVTRVEA